jgi:hypothetical protein
MQAQSLSDGMVTRNIFLSGLCLLHIKMLPLFALFQDKSFGIFEGLEEALPLNHIARLAAGDEVIHFPCPAMEMRVNMVNGEDHPVCELVQSIQSAVPALKFITTEHLHGVFPRQVRRGPSKKLLELLQGHGSSSRTRV